MRCGCSAAERGSECCRRLPLEMMKTKIAQNLDELEKLGIVSATDGYQHVINSIAQVCQRILLLTIRRTSFQAAFK